MNKKAEYTVVIPEGANKEDFKKIILLSFLLDGCFYSLYLQEKRIKHAQKEGNIDLICADIHYYLIAIKNLKSVLKKIKGRIEDKRVRKIIKKYIKELEPITNFRDHLEHICDGRLEGFSGKGKEQLKEPSILGNISFDDCKYNFGGKTLDLIKTFKLVKNVFGDLSDFLKNNPGTQHYKYNFQDI